MSLEPKVTEGQPERRSPSGALVADSHVGVAVSASRHLVINRRSDDERGTFWLVNSGTTDDPLSWRPGAVHAAFMKWDARQGPVHGLDRAYPMRPGDVLIFRSVGTPVSRLVAVGTVLSPPEENPFLRWTFQVRREITDLIATLRYGPPFDLLGIAPVRMTKRLGEGVGTKAVDLIRSAAKRAGD